MTKTPRGFTLIETMIAVAIFTIAVVGPFTAASRSLDAAATARDNLAAANLAQEGLEVVRFVRGSNYLANPNSWTATAGLSACVAPAKCAVDGPTATVAACAGGVCGPLYLTDAGLYTTSAAGATVTRFTRSLTITPNPGGQANAERAVVTVTWQTNGGPRTVTVSQDFYDWL
jgi:prepilin-type N-terminal cleavage/methylation domain-containing protein